MSSATASGRHGATASGRHGAAAQAARRRRRVGTGALLVVMLVVLAFAVDYAMSGGHRYVPDRRAPNRPPPGRIVRADPGQDPAVAVPPGPGTAPPAVGADTGYADELAQQLARIDPSSDGDAAAFLACNGSHARKAGADAQAKLVAALTSLCRHEDAGVRAAALAVLARVPESHLLPADAFVSSFSDADAGVRREAVAGRARQGVLGHWQALLPLVSDASADVRAAVASALGDAANPEARAAVAGMLADEDDRVVEAAADAVCRRRDASGAAPALAALSSPRPRVRLAAVRVLGRIGTRACLAPVVALLEDGDPAMRREAIRALASFDGEPAIEARVRVERVASDVARPRAERIEALQTLASTASRPDAETVHAVASSDPDLPLRLAAARTLLARGDGRACAVLVALLDAETGPKCDDADRAFVRSVAARTLREAFGAPPGDGDGAWRGHVAELEERVHGAEFRYRPERLDAAW